MNEKESALMRNLPGMAYRMVNDGMWTVEYVSEGCRKLFGEKPYELIRANRAVLANLVHEESFQQVQDGMAEALAEGRPYKLVYRVNSLTEEEKWVWDQGEGIYTGEGRLVAVVGFITDFTAHKEMEHELRAEILRLKHRVEKRTGFAEIKGNSSALLRTLTLIEQSAQSDANVIVTGESGTGKELVSRAIHDRSGRKDGPFVPVNCGAIPENLLESEFFGCCRGAFSGAVANREGILDRADGGTLFLDEVGEISLGMQTKLLRAIEGGGYTAVGGAVVKRPDVRIIAATNRNLSELVRSGGMREDFYYRIHVLSVPVPPLRERIGDLPDLVWHFLAGRPDVSLPGAREMAAMEQYHWPGNIRELQNVLNRYATIGTLDLPHLKEATPDRETRGGTLRELMKAYEKQIIQRTLGENRASRTETAASLGIDRRSLYSKIKEHGIVTA